MRHNVLVVEARKQLGERLIEALRAEKQIGQVVHHSTLDSSLAYLRGAPPVSMVFVADDFPRNDILYFLAGAKTTSAARDGAFIYIIQSSEARIGSISTQLIGGMDGFISAPFSLEAVQKVVAFAEGVRVKNVKKRIEAACQLQIAAVMKEIDNRAIDLKFGRISSFSSDLVSAFKNLHTLRSLELEVYFELLLKMFEYVSPPPAFVIGAQEDAATEPVDPVILEALSKELESDNWEVRAKAAVSIGALGRRAACLAVYLTPLLSDSKPLCRQRAKRALQAMGTEEARVILAGVAGRRR